MLVLLDTNDDLSVCATELQCPVGQLLTPLTRFALTDPSLPWAIDNGAFSRFDERSFVSLLDREAHHRNRCLFVTAPDIVGSARRTLEVFERWLPRLAGGRWPVALACQDGQEDLPIPWDAIAAIFIGGSTNWKLSAHAAQCIKAAKILGKWVHVGRINTPGRFEYFEDLGADSIDGSGIARYTHMREAIGARNAQPNMELFNAD
jgi:hypothetical protein